jgi:hypothetical protein
LKTLGADAKPKQRTWNSYIVPFQEKRKKILNSLLILILK